MKKLIHVILVLMMLCSSVAAAAAAAGPSPAANAQGPAVTVVAYGRIGDFIAENNPSVRAVMQSYRMLEIRISVMQANINDLRGRYDPAETAFPPEAITAQIRQLQSAIRELRDELQYMDRDLNRATEGQVHAARAMYIKHYILSEQLNMAQRALENARQDLALQRTLLDRGFISQSVVDEFERGVTSGRNAIRAVNRAIDENLTALARLLGILTPITLDGLPEIDLERVTERDLEADLAAYRLSAPDVQERKIILDNATDALNRSNNRVNRHARQVAYAEYDRARTVAAADFPNVYQGLLDIYEDYVNSTVVKDAEAELSRLQSQFAAGFVSRNRVEAAQRALLDAQSKQEQERISVFLALLEYEYGLINWV